MNVELFEKEVGALGLHLSQEQLDAFSSFEDALYLANQTMNLTRVPKDECWARHFVDSLLVHALIPLGSKVLDVGTGPGFPAWPLACARPDLKVVALDANGKMLTFLDSHALPNLTTVKERAEEWRSPSSFDFVTGRAVAPLSIQLEISARFCKIGGLLVPMRTPADRAAIAYAPTEVLGLALREVIDRPLADTEIIRVFPVFEKQKKTLSGYPRRWAEIKKNPL